MPDIALRFHKDMLVLSAPLASSLARQGVNVERDLEYINLIEPDTVHDALRLESVAGAQCLVTNTAGITPARLTHHGFEQRAPELAAAALSVARGLKPQHLIVEIGPCGLPLDASSKNSLNAHRDQYARAARAFADCGEFDAFFLNGMTNAVDMKCALMGVRQVSDAPVLASVDVSRDGALHGGRQTLEEALEVMAEYGADAGGFATDADQEGACELARRARAACELPIIVQLAVREVRPRQMGPTGENPYYCADMMMDAAARLRAAGVQFLRATGAATPAYTGALVAATEGLDVVGGAL